MFRGLKYLKVPGSGSNRISYIEAGAFVNLTLTHLWLKNNPLETLINETDNPLVCDARMCWVKQSGLISWTRLCGKPECKNYPGVDWDNVTLDCLLTGTSTVTTVDIHSENLSTISPEVTVQQNGSTDKQDLDLFKLCTCGTKDQYDSEKQDVSTYYVLSGVLGSLILLLLVLVIIAFRCLGLRRTSKLEENPAYGHWIEVELVVPNVNRILKACDEVSDDGDVYDEVSVTQVWSIENQNKMNSEEEEETLL